MVFFRLGGIKGCCSFIKAAGVIDPTLLLTWDLLSVVVVAVPVPLIMRAKVKVKILGKKKRGGYVAKD